MKAGFLHASCCKEQSECLASTHLGGTLGSNTPFIARPDKYLCDLLWKRSKIRVWNYRLYNVRVDHTTLDIVKEPRVKGRGLRPHHVCLRRVSPNLTLSARDRRMLVFSDSPDRGDYLMQVRKGQDPYDSYWNNESEVCISVAMSTFYKQFSTCISHLQKNISQFQFPNINLGCISIISTITLLKDWSILRWSWLYNCSFINLSLF